MGRKKGFKMSEEHKKKISLAMTGKIGYYSGKKRSEDYKRKMKEAMKEKNKGKVHTEEHNMKIRNSCIGKNKGNFHSEESKEKISKALKGKIPWNKGKEWSQKVKDKIIEARKNQIIPLTDSSIEIKLQNFLKLLHIEFFTHQYMHINNGYQCDIYIPSTKTVIEADGCYWHCCPVCNKNKSITEWQGKQIQRDILRTKELKKKGYNVIRLWEHEIKTMGLKEMKNILKQSKGGIK